MEWMFHELSLLEMLTEQEPFFLEELSLFQELLLEKELTKLTFQELLFLEELSELTSSLKMLML